MLPLSVTVHVLLHERNTPPPPQKKKKKKKKKKKINITSNKLPQQRRGFKYIVAIVGKQTRELTFLYTVINTALQYGEITVPRLSKEREERNV